MPVFCPCNQFCPSLELWVAVTKCSSSLSSGVEARKLSLTTELGFGLVSVILGQISIGFVLFCVF